MNKVTPENSYLMVPVKVDALFQASDALAIGSDIAFDELPYFDSELGLDINPSSPYLAESCVAQPFKDSNFVLKKGMHLKWCLPDFLQSSHPISSENHKKTDQVNASVSFPPVPTRWLISRYSKDTTKPEKQWVVESDTLYADLKGSLLYGHAQTSIEIDIDSGERPYTYMGRVSTLAEWLARKGQVGSGFTTWKDTHNNKPLTAAGWGTPAFDTFYPNSNGVFSFYDPQITATGYDELSYSIIGWYGDQDDDYWASFVNDFDRESHHQNIDNIEHLEEQQKQTFKREFVEKMLVDKLGIRITAEANELVLPQSGMICYAKVIPNIKTNKASKINVSKFKVAVGNTPTESLSAMLVGEKFADLDSAKREKKEDQFEAMLLGGQLKSLKMDIGAKFREIRHQGEFAAADGGTIWRIEIVDGNQQKALHGDPHAKVKRPSLPSEASIYLEKLNKAQANYDRVTDELESAKAAVYADWCRYMQCAYPPAGETSDYLDSSKVMDMMRKGSLATYREAINRRGIELVFNKDGPLANSTDANRGHSLAVLDAHATIEQYLSQVANKSISKLAKNSWEVHHSPAPRYWEPAPPVIVLALPAKTIRVQQRSSRSEFTQCRIFSKPINLNADKHDVQALLDWLQTTCAEERDPGNSVISETSHTLFRTEWQTEIFPLTAMRQQGESAGQYNTEVIRNHFLLAENEPDLDFHPSGRHALQKTADIYTGTCYNNLQLKDRYLDLLSTFKTLQGESKLYNKDIKIAESFLKTHQLVSFTLSGFNSALLQMHESIQLNPADPLGFEDNRLFAQEVGKMLSGGKGFSPDPHSTFMPIRAGGLRLLNLRLIDHFGRKFEVSPHKIHTTLSLKIANHQDWIKLPPRLSQAARINFRFLQAQSLLQKDSHSHIDSTPLCGWVVPNLLDKSLFFYHADGKLHGYIKQNGQWTPSALQSVATNPTLIAIINWVTLNASKQQDFLSDLLESIEEAMDNIHPLDSEDKGVFSLLIGRPMALVNVSIDLQLKGNRAFNLNWSQFASEVNSSERETDGYEKVQFPFRLGEYIQRNDGLVGFWPLPNRHQVAKALHINDSISAAINIPDDYLQQLPNWLAQRNQEWAITRDGQTLINYLLLQPDNKVKKQDLIRSYTRDGAKVWQQLVELDWLRLESKIMVENSNVVLHYSEASTLSVSIADQAKEFACLMDPYGKLHLSSGIQPVKAIALPERFVVQALKNIEISFLTAPLLGPEDAAAVSLPKEQDYAWSWRENNQWPTALENQGSSSAEMQGTAITAQNLQGFKTNAHFNKRNVIREGRLQLKPTDNKPNT